MIALKFADFKSKTVNFYRMLGAGVEVPVLDMFSCFCFLKGEGGGGGGVILNGFACFAFSQQSNCKSDISSLILIFVYFKTYYSYIS